MAWPDDARYKTFAANQSISSAFLNEIQDQIFANHAARDTNATDITNLENKLLGTHYELLDAVAAYGANWTQSQYTMWWTVDASSGYLYFYVPRNYRYKLTEVRAKVYNGDASSHDWDLNVHLQSLYFDSATMTPTTDGGTTHTATQSILNASPGVITYTFSGGLELTSNQNAVVEVGPTYTSSDVIYGVRAAFERIA